MHLHSQVWQYPYSTIDNDYSKENLDKTLMKIWSIDSSQYNVTKVLYEYGINGRLLREFYSNDTIIYTYDEFGYKLKRQSSLMGDTFYKYIRDSNNLIINKLEVHDLDTSIVTYKRDLRGNLIEILVNSQLRKKFEYNQENKMTVVKEFLNENYALSTINSYEFKKDTVMIEICPYALNGERYRWPCEKRIGIFDSLENLIELKEIYYNGNDEPDEFKTNYVYDKSNRQISSISDHYGRKEEIRNHYNQNGQLLFVEILHDETISRVFRFEIEDTQH